MSEATASPVSAAHSPWQQGPTRPRACACACALLLFLVLFFEVFARAQGRPDCCEARAFWQFQGCRCGADLAPTAPDRMRPEPGPGFRASGGGASGRRGPGLLRGMIPPRPPRAVAAAAAAAAAAVGLPAGLLMPLAGLLGPAPALGLGRVPPRDPPAR